jgi:hypothetical protein
MRLSVALISAFAVLALPAAAGAAPCKDAKGKFVKCPPAAAASTATKTSSKAKTAKKSSKMAGRCRNAKGQFAKCGTPGAKPA